MLMRFLVWGFFCQGVWRCATSFFFSSVSLFDLKARFFVPTRFAYVGGAQEVSRLADAPTLRCSALPGPHLHSFEHDGTFGPVVG